LVNFIKLGVMLEILVIPPPFWVLRPLFYLVIPKIIGW